MPPQCRDQLPCIDSARLRPCHQPNVRRFAHLRSPAPRRTTLHRAEPMLCPCGTSKQEQGRPHTRTRMNQPGAGLSFWVTAPGPRARQTGSCARPTAKVTSLPLVQTSRWRPRPPMTNLQVSWLSRHLSADGFEATVRSQIAELRATFASAAPDVAERLAALAVKESALSGRGSRILAEDSPQRFNPH